MNTIINKTNAPDNRPQISLSALFGAIIAFGLLFGILASIETMYSMTIRCNTLPANDEGLIKWFNEQEGVQKATASRQGDMVKVEFAKRHGTFELFSPPLGKLSYGGLVSMETTIAKTTLVGASLKWLLKAPKLFWFTIAAVFALIFVWQVIIRPKTQSVEADSP